MKEILNFFDAVTNKNFDELEVCSRLMQLLPKDKSEINKELNSEIVAFSCWNQEEYCKEIDANEDMIDYWEKRAQETKNPIMKARYSWLVWNFKEKVTGQKSDYIICENYINAVIDIANGDFFKHKVYVFSKLNTALAFTIGLNNAKLIEAVKQAIINFENRHAVDNLPGLWGHSYTMLIFNKNVQLTEEEEKKIIDELENRMKRLSLTKEFWALECCVLKLAEYYRKKQKDDDVKRVVLEIGNIYEKIIDDSVSAMQIQGWLMRIHSIYIQFGLKDVANSILKKIDDIGLKVVSEMQIFSYHDEINKDEMDNYLKEMLEGNTLEYLSRIAVRYIPKKEEVKEQIFKNAKQTPLQFICHCERIDEKGRVVANVGSLENDLEGRIVLEISNNLSFSSSFLLLIFKEAINKKGLNKDELMEFIKLSPIISENMVSIINKGIEAYFKTDYLVFMHLIIPQIEEAFRQLLKLCGGNTLKPARNGGYNLKTLDDLLREELVLNIFGEDATIFFKILFTDQRGWNIRNRVCHGIVDTQVLNNPAIATRVLHALICLGLVRKENSV